MADIDVVFEGWICDTCGELIKKPSDGWVEWISYSGETKLGRDLRLVHHYPASPLGGEYGCQFNQNYEYQKDGGIVSDFGLDFFLGPNGLMFLLSMIKRESVPIHEILEIIKRVHIPGYEHARLYFNEAIDSGVFEPNMPENFYWQSDINATLDFAKPKKR